MSNNIYDILKKMHDLEAPKQKLTEGKKAKPDYIDIDKDGDKTEPMKKAAKEKSKGAVAEAVARVEQQLAGKYQGWKKINEEEKMIRKVIPVGVIDGPGGYDEAQKRIQDYEAGKINNKGEPLPPIEDRSRPAEKPKTNVGRKEVDEETQQWQLVKQGAKDVADVVQGLATMATGGKLRSIDQRMADAERAEQAAVNRAAAEKGYEVGTKYHNQLIKTNPAYREEYMSLAKDAPMGQLRNIQNRLQLKHDPMGGPMDESALQAHIGMEKYGRKGMRALQNAGREGASKEKMARIRAQHDKMDEDGTVPPKHYGGTGPTGAAFDLYMAKRKEALAAQKPKNEGRYIASTGQSYKDLESFMSGDDRHEKQPRTYDQLQPDRELNPKDTTTWRGPKKHIQHRQKTGGIRGPRGPLPEGEYNEDMLSPKQKKFAALAEPKNKITYADKIAGAKQGKKTEGNKFSGNLMKARQKGLKRADLDGDGDMEPVREGFLSAEEKARNPDYQAAKAKRQAQADFYKKHNTPPEQQSSSSPEYQQWRADRDKQIQQKTRAELDQSDKAAAEREASRSPVGKAANYMSRLVFGQDLPEGRTSMREGWEEMQAYLEKKRGPESKGGAGKKAGTRYGGSAQRDDDEETDGEGQAVVKKKGRPKGTGGGAKFNFKKPKD
jgi:hypothetical protein